MLSEVENGVCHGALNGTGTCVQRDDLLARERMWEAYTVLVVTVSRNIREETREGVRTATHSCGICLIHYRKGVGDIS